MDHLIPKNLNSASRQPKQPKANRVIGKVYIASLWLKVKKGSAKIYNIRVSSKISNPTLLNLEVVSKLIMKKWKKKAQIVESLK